MTAVLRALVPFVLLVATVAFVVLLVTGGLNLTLAVAYGCILVGGFLYSGQRIKELETRARR